MEADPLKSLFLPFESGALRWPEAGGRVLFVNGEDCAGLPKGSVVQQFFRPKARGALAGFPDGVFDVALVLGTRQQVETHWFIAQALERLSPDGVLVCAAANDEGGKRLRKELAGLGLEAQELIKHKSRVVWAAAGGAKAAAWLSAGAPQQIFEGRFVSQPGVFGWDKIDAGSALLVQHLPGALAGRGADFGCGYGFIADHVLRHCGGVEQIFCLDADARAVDLCRENVAASGAAKKEFVWADLTKTQHDLPKLDWIVMNPPFHQGKKTQASTGQAFILSAAAALRPGGSLWMVANAHLPYEAALQAQFSGVEKVAEEKGFKVYHAVR